MSDTLLQRLAASLVSRPFVYELVQRLAGREKIVARIREELDGLPIGRVLDVGSSSGGLADRAGLSPVCLDVDLRPLFALRRRGGAPAAIGADAALLPFSDRTFHLTLCAMIFHHLDDTTVSRVPELSRVTSGYLVFLEPLLNEKRPISRWLWRYDRGRYPRTAEDLSAHLERTFRLASVTRFAVYHEYLLCLGIPKATAVRRGTG